MSGIDDILVDALDVDKPALRRHHKARQKVEMRDDVYGIVGDGVALDVTGLQTAVNDAANADDELIIRSGRYSFGTAGTLTLTDRSRLAFDDGVTFVRTGSSSLPMIKATSKAGIKLRGGFTVEHEGSSTADTALNAAAYFEDCIDTEVADLSVQGPFYVGVVFHGGEGWEARRIHTRGVRNRGIYPYMGTKHGRIVRPNIDGRNVGGSTATTTYGINLNAANSGGSTRVTEDVQISGGEIRYCTHQGVGLGDLVLNCSVDNVLAEWITQFYGFVALVANGSPSNRLPFTNCRAYKCGLYGFYGAASHYLKFMGCYGIENGLDGFALLDATYSDILGCTAHANGQSGVNLLGGCTRIKVLGNTLVSNPFGFASAATNSKILYDNNTIHGNTTNISDGNVAGNFVGTNITT